MAHEIIIDDGIQQPTNVIQTEHTQMEHNQTEHTPNGSYDNNNNNLDIFRDFSETMTAYTTNKEFSFTDNQLGTSTHQYYHPTFTTSYYTPQHNSPLQFQNNFTSINSPQMGNSEIFRLNIPGFKIIVIPNSVNLVNLDLQNIFQQDPNPNIVTENPQTDFQNTFDYLNDSFDFNNF
ncbi:unnamed protein product [Rhizophagus irregularis]|uniref:Uncharacterized protein n=1 Tax=Rhizophagus irregularis TaxID=588596 RepID=A0A2N1MZA3_9GLOM|nr:hypothetical protein RhiirC2_806250 [Rhizophagus irregularis]CAB4395010.1 unnamed protein product [Rhizophagus irregularis]CAB5359304.1 unnamed protein product [Rhizophagus irregularis]